MIAENYLDSLDHIQSLLDQGKHASADHEFDQLLARKFNIADRLGHHPQIAERYAARLAAHPIISTMKAGLGFESKLSSPLPVAKWSVPCGMDLDKLRGVINRLVSHCVPPGAECSGPVHIVTFGSCFAANLALGLDRKGVGATSLLVEESINSPEANVRLLRALDLYPEPAITEHFGGDFLATARAKLRVATHIIVTLGVAPHFTDQNGQFVFAVNYRIGIANGWLRMRTPNAAETYRQIKTIIALLKAINPTAQLVFTISPVPLAGTTEYPNAILADCVSKSTLRAALDRVCRTEGIIYFPSFEIVRWLAPYTDLNHYGAEDGSSRHVSDWLVAEIVGAFMDRFGVRA